MTIDAGGSMFRDLDDLDDVEFYDLGKVGNVPMTKDEPMCWKGKDNGLKLKDLCKKSLSSSMP